LELSSIFLANFTERAGGEADRGRIRKAKGRKPLAQGVVWGGGVGCG